jgi:hypothetical protein
MNLFGAVRFSKEISLNIFTLSTCYNHSLHRYRSRTNCFSRSGRNVADAFMGKAYARKRHVEGMITLGASSLASTSTTTGKS